MYRQHKTKLQAALSHIGIHPPHIIDASWTLDFCVKVSHGSKLLLKNLCAEDFPFRLLKFHTVPKNILPSVIWV